MISTNVLRELINQKLKDTNILIAGKSYSSAIYMAGYALELALKLKVCKILKLKQGFPGNKTEFVFYQNSQKSQPLLAGTIMQIKDVRNHNLNKLLFYSGLEYQIRLNYLNEWNLVIGWHSEMRYKVQKVLKKEAINNINAVKILVANIL